MLDYGGILSSIQIVVIDSLSQVNKVGIRIESKNIKVYAMYYVIQMFVSKPVKTEDGDGNIVQKKQKEVRVSLAGSSETPKWYDTEDLEMKE